MREGTPLPASIQNAPELPFWLSMFFEAFHALNPSRYSVNGTSPIPWDLVQAYAVHHDFDEYQTEQLHYFVAAMDRVYLEHEGKTRTK